MPKRLSGETTSNVNITIGSGDLKGNFIGDLTGNATSATIANKLFLFSAGFVKTTSTGVLRVMDTAGVMTSMGITNAGSGQIITDQERLDIGTNNAKPTTTDLNNAIATLNGSIATAVVKTGAQTIEGVKTFTERIVGSIDEADETAKVNVVNTTNTNAYHSVLLSHNPSSAEGQKSVLRSPEITYNDSTNKLNCGTTGNADTATVATKLALTTAGYVKTTPGGTLTVDSTSGGSLLTPQQAGYITTNLAKPTVGAVNLYIANAVSTINDAQAQQDIYIAANNAKPTTSTVAGMISGAVSTLNTAISTLTGVVNTNADTFRVVYNIGFKTGNNVLINFASFNGTNESTGGSSNNTAPQSASENCSFIAPYGGRIIRVGWRCENQQTEVSPATEPTLELKLCQAGDGEEVPTTNTVIGQTYSDYSTILDDTMVLINPVEWDLTQGCTYALRVRTMSTAGDTVMCVVCEYTI
jgi:hypothetical protein